MADSEFDEITRQQLLKMLAEASSEYARLAVLNGLARLDGKKPPYDLDAYVETGNPQPGWLERLWLRLKR